MIQLPLASEDVTAVFVTMNRCETASTCLSKLRDQTQQPGKVIVVNNASTDGTWGMLCELAEQASGWLELIDLKENLGNAGGMEIAVEAAFSAGGKAVWILDDDSWPEENALQELLACEIPDQGVLTSIVLAPDSDLMSWPCEVSNRFQNWEPLWDSKSLSTERCVEVRRSWLGALIPCEAYEKVGPLKGELFLRGEDEDYPRRLVRAGYRFWMAPASILRHPIAGSIISLALGNQKIWLERDLQGDKLYYRIRNMLWIKKDEAGLTACSLLATGYFFLMLRWFRPLAPACAVFKEAVQDAFADRLGKRRG